MSSPMTSFHKDTLVHDEAEEGNVILEIRAGAGGDEASIFAADLHDMYSK